MFYRNTAVSTNPAKYLRSAAHEIGHAYNLHHEDGDYHLFYERYPAWRLPLSWLPALGWHSWIERRRSRDLERWSEPIRVLRPSLPWHRVRGLGEAVGNPCVVRANGGYLLYYSASLVHVPDLCVRWRNSSAC